MYSGSGGGVYVSAGSGNGARHTTPGSVTISGASAAYFGGGGVLIVGGSTASTNGAAGSVTIAGGPTTSFGVTAGNVHISGGAGANTGGSVSVTPGAGGITPGIVHIQHSSGADVAVFSAGLSQFAGVLSVTAMATAHVTVVTLGQSQPPSPCMADDSTFGTYLLSFLDFDVASATSNGITGCAALAPSSYPVILVSGSGGTYGSPNALSSQSGSLFLASVYSPLVKDSHGAVISKWWLARSSSGGTTSTSNYMLMTNGISTLFWNSGGTFLTLMQGADGSNDV